MGDGDVQGLGQNIPWKSGGVTLFEQE